MRVRVTLCCHPRFCVRLLLSSRAVHVIILWHKVHNKSLDPNQLPHACLADQKPRTETTCTHTHTRTHVDIAKRCVWLLLLLLMLLLPTFPGRRSDVRHELISAFVRIAMMYMVNLYSPIRSIVRNVCKANDGTNTHSTHTQTNDRSHCLC